MGAKKNFSEWNGAQRKELWATSVTWNKVNVCVSLIHISVQKKCYIWSQCCNEIKTVRKKQDRRSGSEHEQVWQEKWKHLGNIKLFPLQPAHQKNGINPLTGKTIWWNHQAKNIENILFCNCKQFPSLTKKKFNFEKSYFNP